MMMMMIIIIKVKVVLKLKLPYTSKITLNVTVRDKIDILYRKVLSFICMS
jgi:hypothetical protein